LGQNPFGEKEVSADLRHHRRQVVIALVDVLVEFFCDGIHNLGTPLYKRDRLPMSKRGDSVAVILMIRRQ
jgi:hypothetical protein